MSFKEYNKGNDCSKCKNKYIDALFGWCCKRCEEYLKCEFITVDIDETKQQGDRVMFVLKAKDDYNRGFSDGYYTGKTYVYQKHRYAIVDIITNAKQYTSRFRAERASEMKFENYKFEVREVKTDV